MKTDIGVLGLAVMGKNLALNIKDQGYKISVFNRTTSKTQDFLAELTTKEGVFGAQTLKEFAQSLQRPRKILLMVKAGSVVDLNIEALIPFLEKGDIIIDGGNSFYKDSIRRYEALKEKGIHFVGLGVSGGEEGARFGPSLMPGGSQEAWVAIEPILKSIAAKTPQGEACCEWLGRSGAGHYVKMVHNAIEYSDMQLIAETYDLLSHGLGLDVDSIADIFKNWNNTELSSYLIEITKEILAFKNPRGEALLNKILDTAGQKGTGRWAVEDSLERGVPFSLMAEAVYGRIISSYKSERIKASSHFQFEGHVLTSSKENIKFIGEALLAAKMLSYVQGFMLLKKTSDELSWNLNYGKIALVWREGCIIKSAFLEKIRDAYDKNPALKNLLLDSYFTNLINKLHQSLRKTIEMAILAQIPVPSMMSALAFF